MIIACVSFATIAMMMTTAVDPHAIIAMTMIAGIARDRAMMTMTAAPAGLHPRAMVDRKAALAMMMTIAGQARAPAMAAAARNMMIALGVTAMSAGVSRPTDHPRYR
jgi:hypothetical protein